MKDFERINKTIFNWDGTFEALANHFTSADYYTILEEANFNEDYYECYVELYKTGVWAECLMLYLEYLLKECIEMRVKHRTDNIFRIWYENL